MQRFADLPSATRLTCLGCRGMLGAVKLGGRGHRPGKTGFSFPGYTARRGFLNAEDFLPRFFVKNLQFGKKRDIIYT